MTRSLEGEFAEYHSSADDLTLIRPERLEESLKPFLRSWTLSSTTLVRQPLAARRAAARPASVSIARSAARPRGDEQLALLWVLNQSDGDRSLLDIAERSGLSLDAIRAAVDRLAGGGLVAERGALK